MPLMILVPATQAVPCRPVKDRSFIKAITTDPDDQAIANAVIAMAENIKLHVTIEGVETTDQMQSLRQEKCDEAQGFHISRPMTAERFLRELKNR